MIYKKTQSNRLVDSYKNNFFYMQGYVNDTVEIVKILKKLSQEKIDNYSNSVNACG